MFRNPATEAIAARRACPFPPLQVANGTRLMAGPQVVDESLAAAVDAAWLPVRAGQVVPLLGERVTDDQPGFDE